MACFYGKLASAWFVLEPWARLEKQEATPWQPGSHSSCEWKALSFGIPFSILEVRTRRDRTIVAATAKNYE